MRDHFIFRGSWWLVDFGFNAPMLAHKSNQPPTNFNDSGGASFTDPIAVYSNIIYYLIEVILPELLDSIKTELETVLCGTSAA